LTESALPFMLESFTYYHNHGELRPRMGNQDPWAAPVGAYRAFGGDNWVAIAVRTDRQWQALADVAGIDTGLGRTQAERVQNRGAIDERVEAWTSARGPYEAVRSLQAAGVPAAPILHN